VWYGRRLGHAGRFEEAIEVDDQGLRRHPGDAELLRHRGHRCLSLRRFDEARVDLERAARAIQGGTDRIELDGAPNDFEIPRGTLHTNVWYHLGLAYHCLHLDELAARAFAQCLAAASNDDFRVAAAYWRALALFHLGRGDDARALAALDAGRELELMESFDYAELLRLFAGTDRHALDALAASGSELSSATLAYGVAMWHRLEGREAEARAELEAFLATPASSAFGRLAAEVELVRMNPPR
jgi:tetratricopeptide (TPR) repeat protein